MADAKKKSKKKNEKNWFGRTVGKVGDFLGKSLESLLAVAVGVAFFVLFVFIAYWMTGAHWFDLRSNDAEGYLRLIGGWIACLVILLIPLYIVRESLKHAYHTWWPAEDAH